MKPHELFSLIKNTKHEDYNESGDHVNWLIKIDNDEHIVRLLFEESDGKRDWLNNLRFPVKPYKKQENTLWVAKGWGQAYKSCKDDIQTALITTVNDYKNYGVEIIGWSYGGAMAVLAAEDFHFRTKLKPNVYTFGAPKPLFGKKSKKYVESCCGEIKQYANVNDCVVVMPPFPGYKHVNKVKVGKRKFNLIEWCKPKIYHTIYDDEEIYQ